MPSLEFVDVAKNMLGTHLMISSVVSPLQEGPEGFDPVRVSLISDVFPNIVTD